jgi:hypothetical protein
MAKIQEDIIIIKLSKLHKDNQVEFVDIANIDVISNLEAVVQELVSSNVIVEVIKDAS